MTSRWLIGLMCASGMVSAARADAPECKAKGLVVESASDHLVIESQNARMWFALPKGDAGKTPPVRIGERVTVTYSSPLKSRAQAIEVREEDPGQAPGEAPEAESPEKQVIEDRAYYPG